MGQGVARHEEEYHRHLQCVQGIDQGTIIFSFLLHELWSDYLFTQAYGDDSLSRALPVQRNPVKIVFSDAECDEVLRQGNFSHWSNISFSNIAS